MINIKNKVKNGLRALVHRMSDEARRSKAKMFISVCMGGHNKKY